MYLAGLVMMGEASAVHFEASSLDSLDKTRAQGVKAEVVEYHGQKGIHVSVLPGEKPKCENCTFLLLEQEQFRDGTIEISLAGEPVDQDSATGGVGIVFRVSEDLSKYEGVYFKPSHTEETEYGVRLHYAIQYFSHPDHSADALNEAASGQYDAPANVRTGQWFRLKAEINKNQGIFYIDGSKVLVVERLFHGSELKGPIGLFVEPGSEGYFSKLEIKHSQ